jgi:hypothetical protein
MLTTTQKTKETEQKKAWEEDKKLKSYDGMFTEEAYDEYKAGSDDDFM